MILSFTRSRLLPEVEEVQLILLNLDFTNHGIPYHSLNLAWEIPGGREGGVGRGGINVTMIDLSWEV
jgi:hypothetical protein